MAEENNPEGLPTKELIFWGTDHPNEFSEYRVENLGSNNDVNFSFKVPHDFKSIISLTVFGVSQRTVTLGNPDPSIEITSDYAQPGEPIATHGTVVLIDTGSFTANEHFELDIAAAFASLAAGDQCGLNVQQIDIGGTISYIGIRLEYL